MKRSTFLSAVVKLVGMALGLLTLSALARTMTIEGMGQYLFVMSVVTVVAIPIKAGLPKLVVRETAQARRSGDIGKMYAIWRFAQRTVFGTILLLAVIGTGVVFLFPNIVDVERPAAVLIPALVLVALLSLGALRAGALQGLGKVVIAQIPETVLRPALMIVFAFAAYQLSGNTPFDAATGLVLQAASLLFAFIAGAVLLRRCRPAAVDTGHVDIDTRSVLMSATAVRRHMNWAD